MASSYDAPMADDFGNCIADEFSTMLDYVLDDAGDIAILYHVHIGDVAEEIEAFEIR